MFKKKEKLPVTGAKAEDKGAVKVGLKPAPLQPGAKGADKALSEQEGKKKSKPREKFREKRSVADPNTPFARALLIPSILGVITFFVAPFLIVIYYSFLDNPIAKEFVGFSNYGAVLGNSAFQTAAKNTLILSAVSVPAAVVFSLLLALLLDAKIPMKSMFRTFFLSPMMVPVASIVLIWQVIFHYNGSLNYMLAQLFEMAPIDWMKSDKSLMVVSVLFLWKNLGYNMILFMTALSNIPKDLIEVARLEGAGGVWVLTHLKLRYISPTVVFVTILSLINSFKLFREVYLLTGDYPYQSLYLLQHFMNNTFRSLDYQKLSSAALIMALVMIFIIGLLVLTENVFGEDIEE